MAKLVCTTGKLQLRVRELEIDTLYTGLLVKDMEERFYFELGPNLYAIY